MLILYILHNSVYKLFPFFFTFIISFELYVFFPQVASKHAQENFSAPEKESGGHAAHSCTSVQECPASIKRVS